MLVFDRGEDSSITALAPATVMALGGEPVGERFIEWNFVSSSRDTHRAGQGRLARAGA